MYKISKKLYLNHNIGYLEMTLDPETPVFNPDGSIAYYIDKGKLKRIHLNTTLRYLFGDRTKYKHMYIGIGPIFDFDYNKSSEKKGNNGLSVYDIYNVNKNRLGFLLEIPFIWNFKKNENLLFTIRPHIIIDLTNLYKSENYTTINNLSISTGLYYKLK